MVWREYACWDEKAHRNPVAMFPIKKRTNTERFTCRKTVLYIRETRMSVVTNEGDQPADWESKYTLRRHANLVSKFTGKMRDQV